MYNDLLSGHQAYRHVRMVTPGTRRISTHHFTSTSSHAPMVPIPMPVSTRMSHIFAESSIGASIPLQPLCECSFRPRILSALSSHSQSIELPSTYAGRLFRCAEGGKVPSPRSSNSSAPSRSSTKYSSGLPELLREDLGHGPDSSCVSRDSLWAQVMHSQYA